MCRVFGDQSLSGKREVFRAWIPVISRYWHDPHVEIQSPF